MHATDIRPILNFKIHFDVEIRCYTGYSDYCWEFLRLIYLILVSQLAASGAQATYHSLIGVNPAGDAGDVSPPIFWLVVTSMGMSPPIFRVAM